MYPVEQFSRDTLGVLLVTSEGTLEPENGLWSGGMQSVKTVTGIGINEAAFIHMELSKGQ